MKTKLVITLTSSALLTGGGGGESAEPGNTPAQSAQTKPPAMQAAQLTVLSKAEMKKLLAQIEKAKAPEPKMGAMCYDMAMPPERMEYVCPACGEKTLYTRDVSWTWTYELPSCRRLFKEIPKHEAMTLDESSFCKKCQPDSKAPELKLILRFDGGMTNVVPTVTSQDLRLLRDFLGGKLLVRDGQDFERPIKEHLPRLRQLLGE